MANNKATIFLSFGLLLLFLFIIISMGESRVIKGGIGIASTTGNEVLICDKIYGAGSGDTCFSIAQQNNLTTEFFSALNPNLNCSKIFVGEWLCIDGLTA